MPRTARIAPGGLIYHVLNRGVGKMTLFRSDKDYAAFVRCLIDTLKTTPVPLLGYCLMSNHWSRRAGSALAEGGWGSGEVHDAADDHARAAVGGASACGG